MGAWARRGASDWLKRATASFHEGHFVESVSAFSTTIDLDSSCFDAYVSRGAAFSRLGQCDAAWADFEKAVATTTGPLNAAECVAMAVVYSSCPKPCASPEKALPFALRAVELTHRNHRTELGILGAVYYALGQIDNAISAYETAIALDDPNRTCTDGFGLAVCYQRQGRKSEARRIFAKEMDWLNGYWPNLSPLTQKDMRACLKAVAEILGTKAVIPGDVAAGEKNNEASAPSSLRSQDSPSTAASRKKE